MNLVLVGYYWYRNFGDELLLLWLIHYLSKKYTIQKLSIVSPDSIWLNTWLQRHQSDYNFYKTINQIHVIPSVPNNDKEVDLLVIGGWEVLTDARAIPHNGWNYLLRYWNYVWKKKLVFAWWVGTIKRPWTAFLYQKLLSSANSVIVREQYSYEIVKNFTNKGVLHRDFAYDALEWIDLQSLTSPLSWEYALLNCNTHIYTSESIQKISQWLKVQEWLWRTIYFIAGTAWEDDSDVVVYRSLLEKFPQINHLDRMQYSVRELAWIFAWAKHGLAARLHVVLMLDRAWIEYEPLVYQEKVARLIDKT